MELIELIEILESSSLSSLFIDLNESKVKVEENYKKLNIQLDNPFANDEEIFLSLYEQGDKLRFFIFNLGVADDVNLIARVGHVNKMTTVPKMSWDPEDKSVHVEWMIFNDDNSPTPIQLEWLLAKTMYVYYNEKLFFLSSELQKISKQGLMGKEKIDLILDTVIERLENDIFPILSDVM